MPLDFQSWHPTSDTTLCQRTPGSLTEGILRAIEEPLHTEMSVNASESVKDLTWPRYVERLERILEETVEDFKRKRGFESPSSPSV